MDDPLVERDFRHKKPNEDNFFPFPVLMSFQCQLMSAAKAWISVREREKIITRFKKLQDDEEEEEERKVSKKCFDFNQFLLFQRFRKYVKKKVDKVFCLSFVFVGSG